MEAAKGKAPQLTEVALNFLTKDNKMQRTTLTRDELNEMVNAMQQSEDFQLSPPEGYDSDEPDSLGDLDTNEFIDDSRDVMEDYAGEDAIADDFYYEDDGQPTEYQEWQDVYGGDDWDHGQYDY